MKTKVLPFILVFVSIAIISNAQNISFSFTANYICDYAESDSITIENLTQGGDTTLYWNDTVLSFSFTNINEIDIVESGFYVSQNYPNPFETKTEFNVFVPERDDFSFHVYDLAGRELANFKDNLEYGIHNFIFHAGNSKAYILTVQSNKNLRHIKMIQFGQAGTEYPHISYKGIAYAEEPEIKLKSFDSPFPYVIGDELRLTCHLDGDKLSITDSPTKSENYVFDWAKQTPDAPTPGTHIPYENHIIWHWNEVPRANGYKYNIIDDYSSATDNGTSTSFIHDGLDECTNYNIYVWAYNNCRESEMITLTQTTTGTVPNAPTADNHVSYIDQIEWNWNEITEVDGYKYNTINDYSTAVDNGTSTSYTQTDLECDETYHLFVWAYNSCGNYTVSSLNATTLACAVDGHPCPGMTEYTDERDGNVYSTIQIGEQCWMTRNLAYLPSVVGPNANSQTTAYYYVYGYDGTDIDEAKASSHYETYGVLYNWTAAMNGSSSSTNNPSSVQGICPSGWHLPSDAEWSILTDYLIGESFAGGKLKETGTTHWISPNNGATNEIDFTALPGGGRYGTGSFNHMGHYGGWWTSTEKDTDYSWDRGMSYDVCAISRRYGHKEWGFSVRCVRD
jgi:uncharacterized protein (TIGR02145 family)